MAIFVLLHFDNYSNQEMKFSKVLNHLSSEINKTKFEDMVN